VVRIDREIAFGADDEIDLPVARDLVEHVVEKRNAGGELGAAAAVEAKLDHDPGFRRPALDARAAR